MTVIQYRRSAERPSLQLWLLDDDGDLIDFSTGYTFQLKIGTVGSAALLTKTLGITGDTGSGTEPTGTPNITVSWSTGELDLAPSVYDWELTCNTAATDRVFAGRIRIVDIIT